MYKRENVQNKNNKFKENLVLNVTWDGNNFITPSLLFCISM